jgi:beta-lactamase class A
MKGKLLLLVSAFAFALATAIVFFTVQSSRVSSVEKPNQIAQEQTHEDGPVGQDCGDISIVRDYHAGLTKPLLFADLNCESSELSVLKEKLNAHIEQLKATGILKRASVYFKELNSFRWILAGDGGEYYPASMLKIAVMLNVLKSSEQKPELLDQQLQLTSVTGFGVMETPSKQLEKGNFYSVRELLEAMIVRSNNDATRLLFSVMDDAEYAAMYSKLSIPQPDPNDFFYQMSAVNLAKFYRILYNVSYLNEENSEYALKLLTQTEFRGGIAAGIPSDVKLAHKFGEHFTEGKEKQFHDSGIVYMGGSAYVVVIMTEGAELTALEKAVRSLSEICFKNRSGQATEPSIKTQRIQA